MTGWAVLCTRLYEIFFLKLAEFEFELMPTDFQFCTDDRAPLLQTTDEFLLLNASFDRLGRAEEN